MFYRSRRIPSDADVVLIVAGLKLIVKLIDVSETGAKVTLDGPFPEGTPVVLESGRLRLEGEIRWARAGEAGIGLSAPLSPSDQAELACISWSM